MLAEPPTVPGRFVPPRPTNVDGVVGQDEAIAQLVTFVAGVADATKPGEQAVILSGPPGVGKTLSARLVAKALLCRDGSSSLQSCGSCEACRAFQAHPFRGYPDYLEVSAAERSGVVSMTDLTGLMRVRPFGRWRIAFVDEAHNLSPTGQDALLKDIEEPEPFAVIIMATTKPERLSTPLRSRCRHVRLRPARREDRLTLLRARSRAHGHQLGKDETCALQRLEERSGPSYRELVHDLDRLLANGPLTPAAVEHLFPADALETGFRCLERLLADDLAGAIEQLSAWPGSPEEKRAQIQALLLNLSLRDVRGLNLQPDPLHFVSVERRHALLAHFDERRMRSGATSLADYLEDCARFWGADP